jgi:hypothetical protein
MSDEQSRGGAVPSADLIGQLGQILTRLAAVPMRMSGELGNLAGDLPTLSRPGALSARQMSGLTSAIRAQRSTIEALQAQLVAFDEQLAVLEQLVEPLARLALTWAEVERGVLGGDAPNRER